MISRALNANNDVFLSGDRIAIVEDAAEVIQHVRTRLLFYKGEWFLDNEAGTPWFQTIFKKPISLTDVETVLKQRIINTPEVLNLTRFSMDYEGNSSRKLTVFFSAETTYGVINKQEVFINA